MHRFLSTNITRRRSWALLVAADEERWAADRRRELQDIWHLGHAVEKTLGAYDVPPPGHQHQLAAPAGGDERAEGCSAYQNPCSTQYFSIARISMSLMRSIKLCLVFDQPELDPENGTEFHSIKPSNELAVDPSTGPRHRISWYALNQGHRP